MCRINRIAREFSEDLVNIHRACQLIHTPKRRNTRTAGHQRRTCLFLAEKVGTARVHRCPVVGIEQNNILIIVIVRSKVVKEISELPIHRPNLTAVDVLAQRVWL